MVPWLSAIYREWRRRLMQGVKVSCGYSATAIIGVTRRRSHARTEQLGPAASHPREKKRVIGRAGLSLKIRGRKAKVRDVLLVQGTLCSIIP
jgi:hypothetical protein